MSEKEDYLAEKEIERIEASNAEGEARFNETVGFTYRLRPLEKQGINKPKVKAKSWMDHPSWSANRGIEQ